MLLSVPYFFNNTDGALTGERMDSSEWAETRRTNVVSPLPDLFLSFKHASYITLNQCLVLLFHDSRQHILLLAALTCFLLHWVESYYNVDLNDKHSDDYNLSSLYICLVYTYVIVKIMIYEWLGVFTTNVNISSSQMVKLCTIFRMVVTISRLNTGYITETLNDMFSCSRYTYIAILWFLIKKYRKLRAFFFNNHRWIYCTYVSKLLFYWSMYHLGET